MSARVVGIAGTDTTKNVAIAGHGIVVPSQFELAPGVVLEPHVPVIELDELVGGCANLSDYAAVISGKEIANFVIQVTDFEGKDVIYKAWNSSWDFHLLSLAAQAPCCSLFSVSDGKKRLFASANRNHFIRRFERAKTISDEELSWARYNRSSFSDLVGNKKFSSAMRAYGNAQFLPDYDMKIMLLWSGIECLLSVDAELSRRLALYSSIIIQGSSSEKQNCFVEVRKAYGVRSKAVHGGELSERAMRDGYRQASNILCRLLRRCVEIGRVPEPSELDAQASSASIA